MDSLAAVRAWRLSYMARPSPRPLFVSYPSPPYPPAPVPMSRSTSSVASTSSFSPASSLSSAASSWSPSLSHYQDLSHRPAMNQANQPPSSRTSGPLPATHSIASLPSLAHSLSAFPTMTVVTNDMVHYGTLVRTKDASDKVSTLATAPRLPARGGARGRSPQCSGSMPPGLRHVKNRSLTRRVLLCSSTRPCW